MTPTRGLEFRHVSKAFGAVRALRDVSFAVEEGEAHALVGENGAGKSTLLKILAGIVRPDTGALAWRGELLSLSSPKDLPTSSRARTTEPGAAGAGALST